MIQLRPDCLLFQSLAGESVPLLAEMISVELADGAAGGLEPEFVEHATASVFYYFKNHLGRQTVSVAEFAAALEKVLQELGLKVDADPGVGKGGNEAGKDLGQLAQEAGTGWELFFFPRLRASVREQAQRTPPMIRFHGLRGCVKQLLGAQRWSPRCEQFRDHIIEFLRRSTRVEAAGDDCALMVE